MMKGRIMPEYGYFLSTEERGPARLVDIAQQAEASGFGFGVDLRPLPPVDRRAGRAVPVAADRWHRRDVRLEMLEEAVEVMRTLWTGEVVTHRGHHYTVDNARIYTLPSSRPRSMCQGSAPRRPRWPPASATATSP